jgi:lipopolysaccharide assembly outer membrane protein LptD (OstA)
MKVVVQKNVVAKPIVFYIGKIPMAILPFAFFPTRSGRHSGLIIPRFGASQSEGRYLRELGYYWAISDYFDARTTVDYYEYSGWLARGNFNYTKRYAFSGSVNGSFTRKNFVLTDNTKERRWDIAFSHRQTLGQTAYLNASGAFASNNYYRFFSSNRQEQLRRTLLSQATFSKSFGNSTSLSATVSDYKDLDAGSFDRLLPSFSISFGQRQLFGKRDPAKKAPATGKLEERHWYENFYYSLSSSAQNRYSKASDSSKTDRLSSANHNMSLSLNGIKAFFPWLSLNQSMQITENWYDRTREFPQADSGQSRTNRGFAALHLFSYTASTNTKIYGTFQPNLGPIRALRHVVEPSVGFSFRPDFSDLAWGYFQEVTLRDGTTKKFDRFNGATPQGKLASMNISVRNLFQMKTGHDDKLKKIDLFTLSFSTFHNFAAKQFKQSDLTSSLFAYPAQNFSFNMGASHSFYDYDRTTGQTVNRLLYKKNVARFLRLTNINFDASLRLQSKSGETGPNAPAKPAQYEDELDGTIPISPSDRLSPRDYFMDTDVAWQASFSLRFNYNRSNPLKPNRTAQLSLDNASVTLTKNWRLSFYGQFDLREKIIVDQRYTISRDLHCWEMQFFWTPSGFSKGFYFRLGIKAPLLKDIKVEKRGGRSSVFGGSSYFY